MHFDLDPRSSAPIYVQIVDQVRRGVAYGLLGSDERLPSVRELAVALRVNPNTVARAYRELEYEGLIESRQGDGTFVSAQAPRLRQRERERLVNRAMDEAVAQALEAGLTEAEVRELVQQRLQAVSRKRRQGR
jgi:GntR family transcriptional regulator